MASYNMTVSYISGIDVSDALEDIVVQLREARTMTEERKRMRDGFPTTVPRQTAS